MGSRSMPRTLWHLIYRPGYMIRDYITGHRMPYFPPVKMLFVLTAAYALTLHLTRPEASSTVQSNHPSVAVEISNDSTQTEPSFSLSVTHADKANDSEKTKAAAQGQWSDNVLDRAFQFLDRNYALQLILSHAIFAIAALWLFRNPRHGKRMSLTEHFFAQIYIACQLMAISVVYCILSGAKSRLSLLYDMPLPAVLLIMCYDYKQLYGYSTIKTIWKTLLTVVIWAVVLFAILFIIAFVLKMAEQLSAIY